ncbi:hypothetical protein RHECNPAF_4460016 [Rhizobium etli CNPAF512]|nr:hypothetical protein RHECNPAF_4460016 [Rhizobium etli CNPAF512]
MSSMATPSTSVSLGVSAKAAGAAIIRSERAAPAESRRKLRLSLVIIMVCSPVLD